MDEETTTLYVEVGVKEELRLLKDQTGVPMFRLTRIAVERLSRDIEQDPTILLEGGD